MNATLSTHLTRRESAPKLPVFGVTIEVLASRAHTGGHAASYLATCPSGTGAPPHRHPAHDESFYILDGELDLLSGDTVHRLKAGDFAFVPRGTIHGFTSVGPNHARLLGFGTPGGHEEFFQDCADAIAQGTFSPETGMAICQRHGVELMLPANA